MKCPNCDSENVTMVAGTHRCNDCQHYFMPSMAEIAEQPLTAKQQEILDRHRGTHSSFGRQTIRTPVQILRDQADGFAGIGIFALVFGVLLLIIGLATSMMLLDLLGGGLLTSAIWLYLLAQIIHIRANTHK